MSRFARPIVNALAVLSCLPGPPTLAEGPTPDQAHTPLNAVAKREAYAFASIPDGLFRAPLETKRWEKLKTPPAMPLGGTFASQPGRSPLIIYVAMKSSIRHNNAPPDPEGLRHGLYLSRDNGLTWELISERKDFGSTLLMPGGDLFAVTGADGANAGDHLLRSSDLGKTWRDITGKAFGQLQYLEPDPDHPGLIRVDAWAIRQYTFTADDDNYNWTAHRLGIRATGRRPSDEFFSRSSSSTNRYYLYPATLANYFGYNFGNQTQVQALEVVPIKTRYEFAKGVRVVVPIRVVFHHDPNVSWPGQPNPPNPRPAPPVEKLADQPDGIDFWGLKVETPAEQVVKYPPGRRFVTMTLNANGDGKTVTSQPPAVKYRVVDLSPSSPYQRDLDLGRFHDFSKPGEYRVQIIYDSGGHPEADKGVWDGGFDSPPFTIVIK